VKLYLNRTSFSFDDAESIEPTQVLELTEEDYKPDKVRIWKGKRGREGGWGYAGACRFCVVNRTDLFKPSSLLPPSLPPSPR
jgi:hypothetical protein